VSIDNPEIIGFDLGHGESALQHTRLKTIGAPQPVTFNNASTIVTMVARTSDNTVLIGRQVFERPRSDSKVVESYLRFKHPDLDRHAFAGRATRLFVQGIVEALRRTEDGKPSMFADLKEVLFFVGCPSGWKPTVQEEYKSLLREAGLENVTVVPESRAAFMNARERKDLEADELAMRVLLIDIGSSTTDFTWSENLNERPFDFGTNELGAGLLDKLIFERSLAIRDDRDAIENFFDEYPGKRVEVDVKCRQAKEDYFNSPYAGKGAKINHLIKLESEPELGKRAKKIVFEIEVDDKLMASLWSELLPELGNKSWIAAFHDYLETCKKDIEREPDFVYVTGGAAKMRFVPGVVGEVFPNAEMKMDKNPELAIASGLAWFGQAYLKSQRFHRDVDELVKRGAILALIGEKVPLLYEQLANTIGKFITLTIVRPSLISWRDGHIATLGKAETKAKDDAAIWMGSAEVKTMAAEVVREWFNDIRADVHMLSDPICIKYGLDASALDLDPNMRFTTEAPGRGPFTGDMLDDLDAIAALLSLIVATVTGMLLGGSGGALMHLPLIGQIIASVVAFIAFAIGWGEARKIVQDFIKDADIPLPLRWMISVEKIDDKLGGASRDIATELKNKMMETDEVAKKGESLPEKIAAEIEAALRQRAYDQVLRF
jgi:hypothetical protein